MRKKKRVVMVLIFYLTLYFQLSSLNNISTLAGIEEYPAESLVVKDDIAYVAERNGGIELIDASNPGNLENLGRYDDEISVFEELVIVDNYLYAAAGQSGLMIFDISDSASNISPLSEIYDLANITEFLTIVNEIAYIDVNRKGFAIVNVTDPLNPEVKSRNTKDEGYSFGDVYDIAVKDNLAFLVGFDTGLNILDISNKLQPVELYSYTEIPGSNDSLRAISIEVIGDIAYISADRDGLIAFNISDVSTISTLGYYNMTSDIHSKQLYIEGNLAYLITANWYTFEYGFRIINITEPATMIEINSYFVFGNYTEDIFVDNLNNLIYLAQAGDGIFVLDSSDINNLVLIETYEVVVTITTPTDAGIYPLLSLFGVLLILVVNRKKERK
ncbi:MAG: hypothetical protein H7641_14185 [Candidatus Heimdallarchaeota archaeon]|nr:hypothetical protein [Candidatus Heimdallarchaeota archaeon]MCK4878711.1 hypothetical protein [Candidatus Heimdallarchaeota archaeon]